MPSWIVKQPDGKYARFSTIVDDFISYDLTREDVIAEMVGESAVQATRIALKELDRAEGPKPMERALECRAIGEMNEPKGPLPWEDPNSGASMEGE